MTSDTVKLPLPRIFLTSWHCNGFFFLINRRWMKEELFSLVAKFSSTGSQFSLYVKQVCLTDVDWRTEWKGPFYWYLFPFLGSKQKSNQSWEVCEIVGSQAKYNKQLNPNGVWAMPTLFLFSSIFFLKHISTPCMCACLWWLKMEDVSSFDPSPNLSSSIHTKELIHVLMTNSLSL